MMTLDRMEDHLKEQLNANRRLELEAKLYGYWYPEMNNENLIFEAKSDNEVLAQLNMLEKCLNHQGEKNENTAKVHDLEMAQELRMLDHIQQERQQIREQEIREIRTMQETHMTQLKESHHEILNLMEKERKLKFNLEELNKEFELLQKSYDVLNKSNHFEDFYDTERIKVLINQRSEVFRSQIKMCMSILERTLEFAEHPEDIRNLIVLLEAELETDTNAPSKIDVMNAAEAKSCLQHSEEAWQVNHAKCCAKISDILSNESDSQQLALGEIMQRQDQLNKICSAHLDAVDNSGAKLKQLLQEVASSPHLHKTDSQGGQENKKTVPHTHRHEHQPGEESRDFPLHSSCNDRETVMVLGHGKVLEEHKNLLTHTRRHSHIQGEESNESSLISKKRVTNKNESHLEELRHSELHGKESNDSSLNSSPKKLEAHLEDRRHYQLQGKESNDSSLNSSAEKDEAHLEERRHYQLQGKESNDSSLNSSAKKNEAHLEERCHYQLQGKESNDSSLNSSPKKVEARLDKRRHSQQQGGESIDSSFNPSATKEEANKYGPKHEATNKIVQHVSEETDHNIHNKENSQVRSLDGEEEHKQPFISSRRHSHQQGEESSDFPLYSSCNRHDTSNATHAEGRRYPHQQGEESTDFPLYSSCNRHEAYKMNERQLEGRRHSNHQGEESNESSLKLLPNKHGDDLLERQHSQHQGEESNDSTLKLLPNVYEAKDGEEHKQRNMRYAPLHPQQVVTAETEANRPRFGRRHSANKEETIYSHPNANESHNNLSPRCFDSHDCDDIDQASNSFNNLNIDDWQHNPHPTKHELDDMRMINQREFRVVTEETDADRPRFGIKHHDCLNSQLTAAEREELRQLVSSMSHTHQITDESIDSPFNYAGAGIMDQELDEFRHQVGMAVVHTNYK